jgi:limonene-1,2-epoxide hydrolase
MNAPNASAPSPRTVVERYNYELWNEQNYAVGEEILGEEIVRNTPGGRVVQTRQQAVQRVRDHWSTVKSVHFTLLRIVADDELCSIVYQADIVNHDDASDYIAAIEVYRIVDGRVVEVWNPCNYDHDRWPEFIKETPA